VRHPRLAVVLAAALLAGGCKKPVPPPPADFYVTPVVQQDVPIYLDLLGRTPGAIARATAPSATGLGSPPSIPPGLPASLLERRPDVVQAEQPLVAANADVGVWSIGYGLLQPIFNGGRLEHSLQSARAAVDEAVALYRKAALSGYREDAQP
jgi:outer membrane protein TolC